MAYLKITLEVVIQEDDEEILIQGLDNAMEEIEDKQKVTVYSSAITTTATGEPENAAEIAAKV